MTYFIELGQFFREIWQDFIGESRDNLKILLYLFILLGLFLLAFSVSTPRL